MPAEYVALAQELPAVYQDDAESFAQLDGYLAMVDEVLRDYAEEIADVPSWLSPAGAVWPPGVAVDAGSDEVHEAVLALYDTLAGWFAFRFPGSWRDDDEGMARRREFVGRAARLWRRRGTPRGFLDWFCLYFGIGAASRPVLLEHFKYGPAAKGQPDPWLHATLLVPSTTQFRDYGRRVEAEAFVQRYAPSHVLMRLCWGPSPLVLPDAPGARAKAPEVAAYREAMRRLICGIHHDVPHESAIHLGECVDVGTPRDRLDIGRLPGDRD